MQNQEYCGKHSGHRRLVHETGNASLSVPCLLSKVQAVYPYIVVMQGAAPLWQILSPRILKLADVRCCAPGVARSRTLATAYGLLRLFNSSGLVPGFDRPTAGSMGEQTSRACITDCFKDQERSSHYRHNRYSDIVVILFLLTPFRSLQYLSVSIAPLP